VQIGEIALGNEAEKKKRQHRNTLILLVTLGAFFSLLYVFWLQTLPEQDGGETLSAVVQVDGRKVRTMRLDEDTVYKAEIPEGHYNEIEVKDGWVQVRAADCENQVCVKTGWIRNPGEVIACLPHRLIITIEEAA
jgi:hypothetical protein